MGILKRVAVVLLFVQAIFVHVALTQTVYYVADDGDDGNDGLSYPNRKATTANLFATYATAGGIITLDGTFSATFVPGTDDDGTSDENRTIVMSYAAYNGWDTLAVTDTSTMWSAKISSSSDYLLDTGSEYMTFIDIDFETTGSFASYMVRMSENINFYLCRFTHSSSSTGASFFSFGNDASFSYCWFISPSRKENCFAFSGTPTLSLSHCTFKGHWQGGILYDNGSGRNCIVKNTVFNNIRPSDSHYIIEFTGAPGATQQWDYNIHYDPRATNANYWRWEADLGQSFSVWQDSVNNYIGTNADSSQWADPDLLYSGTTCVPNAGSPVIGTASDGRDIGAYQLTAAATEESVLIRNTLIGR